jgi:hypothetical protein
MTKNVDQDVTEVKKALDKKNRKKSKLKYDVYFFYDVHLPICCL